MYFDSYYGCGTPLNRPPVVQSCLGAAMVPPCMPPVQHKFNFPSGKLNVPPWMNAKVTFYDPLTGQVGPSISTLPQYNRTYQYRSNGMNFDITGNPQEIAKMKEIILNNRKEKEQLKKQIQDKLNQLKAELIKAAGTPTGGPSMTTPTSGAPAAPSPRDLQLQEIKKMQDWLVELDKQLNGLQQPAKPEDKTYSSPPLERDTYTASVAGNPVASYAGPWRFNNGLLVNPETSVSYSGSGVLMFDLFNGTPTVLLGRPMIGGGGDYEDWGGPINVYRYAPNGTALLLNAQNEMSQGSCKLFGCNLERSNYLDVVDGVGQYRCYFVCANGTNNYGDVPTLFAQNKNVAPGDNQDLCRFSLLELLKAAKATPTGRLQVKNYNGSTCYVSERTSNILRQLLQNRPLVESIFRDPNKVSYSGPSTVYGSQYGLHTFAMN